MATLSSVEMRICNSFSICLEGSQFAKNLVGSGKEDSYGNKLDHTKSTLLYVACFLFAAQLLYM